MHDGSTLAEILAEGIRFDTVASPESRGAERSRLRAFQEFLTTTFPEVHRVCERTVLSEYGLYFRLPAEGSNGSERPVLLMAHYDVVPVEMDSWSVPPFEGVIRDEMVWGRGAIDDKFSLLAIMYSLEKLLTDGFRPRRDIYLAFGGDEETGGDAGATELVRRFKERGISFGWVLDEGTLVADGVLPGVDGPVAVIGTAEKGHIIVRVSTSGNGGHAAHPPVETPADRVLKAAARIVKRRLPIRVIPTVARFVRELGRLSGGIQGALLRAYPVTAPLVHSALSRSPQTDALIRDTRSVTVCRGSEAHNVISREPYVLLNVRLLPGTTIDSVLKRFRSLVRDPEVKVELEKRTDNCEAPPESPDIGDGYDDIAAAIGSVWDSVPILPYLFTMTTDSRHYTEVTDRIYRFLPIQATDADIALVHDADERISIVNLDRAVRFYTTLLGAQK